MRVFVTFIALVAISWPVPSAALSSGYVVVINSSGPWIVGVDPDTGVQTTISDSFYFFPRSARILRASSAAQVSGYSEMTCS